MDISYVRNIVYPPDETPTEKGHRKRLAKMGYPCYGRARHSLPLQHSRFLSMHNRHRQYRRYQSVEISSLYKRTSEGFINFCLEIGDVPEELRHIDERLHIGRINHYKGYIPGNLKWESITSNSLERIARLGSPIWDENGIPRNDQFKQRIEIFLALPKEIELEKSQVRESLNLRSDKLSRFIKKIKRYHPLNIETTFSTLTIRN